MNKIIREEEKERYVIGISGKRYSRGKVRYSRRDKIGEGFGKRKVGMRVVIKEYNYEEIKEEDGYINRISKISWNIGEIVRIVRRINEGYYDYWYKVKLDNGKYKWVSYVKVD